MSLYRGILHLVVTVSLSLSLSTPVLGAPVKKGVVTKVRSSKSKVLMSRNTWIYLGLLEKAIQNQDFLGARVITKKIAGTKLRYSDWSRVRNILNKYPNIGFDLFFKWGRILPATTSSKIVARNERIDDKIDQADNLMLKGRFNEAFAIYQKMAKYIKNEVLRHRQENYFLYQTLVHYMARALYGAGRYKESLEVYSWISKDYFRFKQVLFEKMWAAFRAGRYDMALGAVASQHSSYFSDVIEPETFLIQIYIFKKLCREEDRKKVLINIDDQKKRMLNDDDKRFFNDWTKSDIEYISLQNLVNSNVTVSYEGNKISTEDRIKERNLIQKSLQQKYLVDRKRILGQLDTVKAFSLLSSAIGKVKVNLDVVPDREALMASGKEFWPVEDAEDWLDESGGHLYIGESQCEDKDSK